MTDNLNLPELVNGASDVAKAMHATMRAFWNGASNEEKATALAAFEPHNRIRLHKALESIKARIEVDTKALAIGLKMTEAELDKVQVRGLRKMVTGED